MNAHAAARILVGDASGTMPARPSFDFSLRVEGLGYVRMAIRHRRAGLPEAAAHFLTQARECMAAVGLRAADRFRWGHGMENICPCGECPVDPRLWECIDERRRSNAR